MLRKQRPILKTYSNTVYRMDAKLSNAAVCLTVCFLTQAANGATFRTANFEVTAPTEQLA
ncbi:MAG: hypothetical protein HON04_15385, partial [Planctomicrobium sp.]|nr:hypothetical protein [Planctomicrobium sp.]